MQKAFFNEIELTDDEIIPAIVILGYAAERRPWKEKLIRTAVRASARKPWKSIFFKSDFKNPLSAEIAGKYAEVLEMTRLAPSAGNAQPWRVIKERDTNDFHFYKEVVNQRYDKKGLHDVDMGICLSHFELSALQMGLKGRWHKKDPGMHSASKDLEYKISWTEK